MSEKRIEKPGEFPKWLFSPTKGERLIQNLADEINLCRGKHDWQTTPIVGSPAVVEERTAAREPEHLNENQSLAELRQRLFDVEGHYDALKERHERLVDAGSAPADQRLIVEHNGLKRAHAALELKFGDVVTQLSVLREEHESVCEERDQLLKEKEEALAAQLESMQTSTT